MSILFDPTDFSVVEIYGWMSGFSLLDAFMSVKMGTFREFQLYMGW